MEALLDQDSRLRRNVPVQGRLLVAHNSFQVGRQAAVERGLTGDMRFFRRML